MATANMKEASILNNSEQKQKNKTKPSGVEKIKTKSSRRMGQGGTWQAYEQSLPSSTSSGPPNPSSNQLIISGSASVLVLGYFYFFSHFHENSSGTNRPTCASKYNKLRTIEEEMWGI